jgi:hypothetical protein
VTIGEFGVANVAKCKALFTNRFKVVKADVSIDPLPTVRPSDTAQYRRGHVNVNLKPCGGDYIVAAILCDRFAASQPQAYMCTERHTSREGCIRV